MLRCYQPEHFTGNRSQHAGDIVGQPGRIAILAKAQGLVGVKDEGFAIDQRKVDLAIVQAEPLARRQKARVRFERLARDMLVFGDDQLV